MAKRLGAMMQIVKCRLALEWVKQNSQGVSPNKDGLNEDCKSIPN